MPKLTEKAAKAVDEAESGQFPILPEGRYAGRLSKVEEKGPGASGFPYWQWEFDAVVNEDGELQAGRQWFTSSLSPKAASFLKAAFEAFGYTTDSDTDEMLGEWAVLHVAQERQTQGANAGSMRNTVTKLSEYVPEDWDFDPEEIQVKPVTSAAGAGEEY